MHASDRQITTAATAPDAGEQPGLFVVHGNRAERLLELAICWTARWPLAPLEPETWLVPSQAVAQWVRQTLAAGPGGVAAGLDLMLPAQWLWQAYRAVLHPADVPDTAPLDKGPLTWRLWRLLPTLRGDTFAPLTSYLVGDPDGRKRGQLARRLADLYDQYQVYRTDWLDDWAAGHDQIRDAHGQPQPLPQGQRWQAALWRAVRADLGETDACALTASRADIHRAFVAAVCRHTGPRPIGLPRRLTVFGLSGLPPATLEALALVARWTQVLVCVLNPCRVYWADMVPDAAWLARIDAHGRAQAERRPGGTPLSDTLGLSGQGHPLLAAWGRQGRDFIALLQAYEERPARDRLDTALQALGRRADLFEDPVPEGSAGTLLTQLQDDILNGRSLAETRDRWPAVDPACDHSLRFHICHTALREVEVLHDQVLAALHRDASLQPRDILVMVPDVAAYAPLFQAVFGRLPPDDPRHVPYTISDVADDAGTRLVQAVRELVALPRSRITASDVLQWLEVPAFARRFGVAAADLDRLRRWVGEAGIRWGLDGQHRQALGLVASTDQDATRLSWREGLRRLWLGYALGGEDVEWEGLVPARRVAPLEAALIERLQTLIDTLARHAERLATPATSAVWVQRLQSLLAECFDGEDPSTDPAEARALHGLRSALLDW
ncbi:MAG: exodeoxyribonuclease V subunit gamma, partial [Tepidimonas sp.]|uniref:exodeoxyribonuclease V subunit gamma n=1 Tax=Tepidimonas sp. TaxID=2002775 RepID=UPI004054CEA2